MTAAAESSGSKRTHRVWVPADVTEVLRTVVVAVSGPRRSYGRKRAGTGVGRGLQRSTVGSAMASVGDGAVPSGSSVMV